MSETFLGVLYGCCIAWGIPFLLLTLWMLATRKRRLRKQAAEARANLRATTVEEVQRDHYLVIWTGRGVQCIDVNRETADLEQWVNDPANHQEQK